MSILTWIESSPDVHDGATTEGKVVAQVRLVHTDPPRTTMSVRPKGLRDVVDLVNAAHKHRLGHDLPAAKAEAEAEYARQVTR